MIVLHPRGDTVSRAGALAGLRAEAQESTEIAQPSGGRSLHEFPGRPRSPLMADLAAVSWPEHSR